MRTPLKISYSAYLKNPKRPSAHYYARVRQGGKVRDIDLHTQDKAMADAWVRLRRSELERYNEYVLVGEEVPAELEQKIVRVNTLSFAQKGPSKASVSLRVALDAWEADMRRRGLREQSISSYMRAMAVTVPNEALLSDVDSKHVVEWLAKHDHCKSATRRLYSVALREFVKYLSKDYVNLKELVLDWPVMVKAERVEKDYWTFPQMMSIINHIETKDKETEHQFKVYCYLMATAGSRQGETALLEWRDFRDGCVTFRAENTKSNETRVVPLDPRIADLLYKMQRTSASELIFDRIPRTQPSRYQLLKYAIRRARAPKGGLHTFRHSVSMLMYKSTQDIKATSQLLGHKEQTALRYYQKSRQGEDLKKVVRDTFQDQILLPDQWDDLAKNGMF